MEQDISTQERAAGLEERASEVARVLKALANQRRLLILCHLAAEGELSVNALAAAVGLSQSALSQHLAVMREDGLIAFRREAQTLRYRIADPKVEALLGQLYDLYCAPESR